MVQYLQNTHALLNKPDTAQQQVRDDGDRICVFHVGPPKTGSTSLQNFLIVNEEARATLRQDNYSVPLFVPAVLIGLITWHRQCSFVTMPLLHLSLEPFSHKILKKEGMAS